MDFEQNTAPEPEAQRQTDFVATVVNREVFGSRGVAGRAQAAFVDVSRSGATEKEIAKQLTEGIDNAIAYDAQDLLASSPDRSKTTLVITGYGELNPQDREQVERGVRAYENERSGKSSRIAIFTSEQPDISRFDIKTLTSLNNSRLKDGGFVEITKAVDGGLDIKHWEVRGIREMSWMENDRGSRHIEPEE